MSVLTERIMSARAHVSDALIEAGGHRVVTLALENAANCLVMAQQHAHEVEVKRLTEEEMDGF